MTINKAVAMRVSQLLLKKNFSKYKLEQESGILHGTLECIMKERNKSVNLRTVMMLARGFGISLIEFLDDPLFDPNNIEID